jgi:thiol-disulfide isomerase/thioredoxin
MSAPTGDEPDAGAWLVACLCAAWCRTCDEVRPSFEALARERPGMRFAWIDIEEESDALGPLALEVENFPTLLVANGPEVRFYGTVLPHAGTIGRTIDAARGAVLTPAVEGLDAEHLRRIAVAGETLG